MQWLHMKMDYVKALKKLDGQNILIVPLWLVVV